MNPEQPITDALTDSGDAFDAREYFTSRPGTHTICKSGDHGVWGAVPYRHEYLVYIDNADDTREFAGYLIRRDRGNSWIAVLEPVKSSDLNAVFGDLDAPDIDSDRAEPAPGEQWSQPFATANEAARALVAHRLPQISKKEQEHDRHRRDIGELARRLRGESAEDFDAREYLLTEPADLRGWLNQQGFDQRRFPLDPNRMTFYKAGINVREPAPKVRDYWTCWMNATFVRYTADEEAGRSFQSADEEEVKAWVRKMLNTPVAESDDFDPREYLSSMSSDPHDIRGFLARHRFKKEDDAWSDESWAKRTKTHYLCVTRQLQSDNYEIVRPEVGIWHLAAYQQLPAGPNMPVRVADERGEERIMAWLGRFSELDTEREVVAEGTEDFDARDYLLSGPDSANSVIGDLVSDDWIGQHGKRPTAYRVFLAHERGRFITHFTAYTEDNTVQVHIADATSGAPMGFGRTRPEFVKPIVAALKQMCDHLSLAQIWPAIPGLFREYGVETKGYRCESEEDFDAREYMLNDVLFPLEALKEEGWTALRFSHTVYNAFGREPCVLVYVEAQTEEQRYKVYAHMQLGGDLLAKGYVAPHRLNALLDRLADAIRDNQRYNNEAALTQIKGAMEQAYAQSEAVMESEEDFDARDYMLNGGSASKVVAELIKSGWVEDSHPTHLAAHTVWPTLMDRVSDVYICISAWDENNTVQVQISERYGPPTIYGVLRPEQVWPFIEAAQPVAKDSYVDFAMKEALQATLDVYALKAPFRHESAEEDFDAREYILRDRRFNPSDYGFKQKADGSYAMQAQHPQGTPVTLRLSARVLNHYGLSYMSSEEVKFGTRLCAKWLEQNCKEVVDAFERAVASTPNAIDAELAFIASIRSFQEQISPDVLESEEEPFDARAYLLNPPKCSHKRKVWNETHRWWECADCKCIVGFDRADYVDESEEEPFDAREYFTRPVSDEDELVMQGIAKKDEGYEITGLTTGVGTSLFLSRLSPQMWNMVLRRQDGHVLDGWDGVLSALLYISRRYVKRPCPACAANTLEFDEDDDIWYCHRCEGVFDYEMEPVNESEEEPFDARDYMLNGARSTEAVEGLLRKGWSRSNSGTRPSASTCLPNASDKKGLRCYASVSASDAEQLLFLHVSSGLTGTPLVSGFLSLDQLEPVMNGLRPLVSRASDWNSLEQEAAQVVQDNGGWAKFRVAEGEEPFDPREYMLAAPRERFVVVSTNRHTGATFYYGRPSQYQCWVTAPEDAERFDSSEAAQAVIATIEDPFVQLSVRSDKVRESEEEPFDAREYLLSTPHVKTMEDNLKFHGFEPMGDPATQNHPSYRRVDQQGEVPAVGDIQWVVTLWDTDTVIVYSYVYDAEDGTFYADHGKWLLSYEVFLNTLPNMASLNEGLEEPFDPRDYMLAQGPDDKFTVEFVKRPDGGPQYWGDRGWVSDKAQAICYDEGGAAEFMKRAHALEPWWHSVTVVTVNEGEEDFDPREYLLADQGLADLRAWLESNGFQQSKTASNESWKRSFWYHNSNARAGRHDRSDYGIWEAPDKPGDWIFQRKDTTQSRRSGVKEDIVQQFHGTPAEILVIAKKWTPSDRHAELRDPMQEADEAALPPHPEDNFDPRDYFMSMARPEDEPQVLEKFREGVRLYAEWALEGEPMAEADAAALQNATRFEQVQAVLAKYEVDPPFLSMVQQGYFVESVEELKAELDEAAELPTPADDFDAREYFVLSDERALEQELIERGFRRTEYAYWTRTEKFMEGASKAQCRFEHIVNKKDESDGTVWIYRRWVMERMQGPGGHLDSKVSGNTYTVIGALEAWDKQKALRLYVQQESEEPFDARAYLSSMKAYEGPPPGKEYWVLFMEGTFQRAVKLYKFKAVQRFVHDKRLENDPSLILRVRQDDDSTKDYTRDVDGSYTEVGETAYREEFVYPDAAVAESEEDFDARDYLLSAPRGQFSYVTQQYGGTYGSWGCELRFGDTKLTFYGEGKSEAEAEELGAFWVNFLTKLDKLVPYDPVEEPNWRDWYTRAFGQAHRQGVLESQEVDIARRMVDVVEAEDAFDAREYLSYGPFVIERVTKQSPERLFYSTVWGWTANPEGAVQYASPDEAQKDIDTLLLAQGDTVKVVPVHESLDDFDAEANFDPREYLLIDNSELEVLIAQDLVSLSGSVSRGSSRYVHEHSVGLNLDVRYDTSAVDQSEQDRIDQIVNVLEKHMSEQIVNWNRRIFHELSEAYDDSRSDAVVADNIVANNYEFTAEGEREDGTSIEYDQLDDEAKERAREWYTNDPGDDFYSESVISEWKWLLQNKGFDDVDISWSGFGSQGDGASFTAGSIDFPRYFSGPDPLVFPEQQREQFESQEEPFDAREYFIRDRYRPKAVNIGGDLWSDEIRLRNVFSWLTRIGAAPKFGSVPIHYYQQDQIKALDALTAAARSKGFELEWVRYRNGTFMAHDKGKWVPIARMVAGTITTI